jgi:hypothetical protein
MNKSWREKLADDKDLPKVGVAIGEHSQHWGTGRFVIPSPRAVDARMKQVPTGRVLTINGLRAAPGRKHQMNFACPPTTGIFSGIAAHAATEARAEGKKRVTPYWRTLKTGGEINPKYPAGAEGVAKRLRAGGHEIMAKGKRMLVADFEKKLFTKLR